MSVGPAVPTAANPQTPRPERPTSARSSFDITPCTLPQAGWRRVFDGATNRSENDSMGPEAPRSIYDRTGTRYTATRRADPRIAAAIDAALGDARTLVNI